MNEISDAKNVKAKITCIAGQTTLDNQREIKVKRWRNYIFTSCAHALVFTQCVL